MNNVIEPDFQKEPSKQAGHNNGNGEKRDVERRLTALETDKYVATKSDLKDIKIWCLSGVVAGMILAAGTAVTIAIAILRFWPS